MPSLPSKINCPKFLIDGLQQWSHMTFSVSFFVTLRNLFFSLFKDTRKEKAPRN